MNACFHSFVSVYLVLKVTKAQTNNLFFCEKNILQHQPFCRKLLRGFGTHLDSFISEDIGCYSQPCFEADSLFFCL